MSIHDDKTMSDDEIVRALADLELSIDQFYDKVHELAATEGADRAEEEQELRAKVRSFEAKAKRQLNISIALLLAYFVGMVFVLYTF